MKVSRSAYYDWLQRPARLITAETLNLYRRVKELFGKSRASLGSREMTKKLRAEGFIVGRHRVGVFQDSCHYLLSFQATSFSGFR
ncbi:IS3 family transposase [Vibrio sp. SCSIO 43137]|uniref:IS3 family transposase n=1 Tax=Vibrio sp. SCSIO 43137 TaxID=3021011 RepID=UPI003FCDC990